VFPDLGVGEILGLAVLALLLFGPDRLPKIAVDAARVVRKLRLMYANASAELRSQVGDDLKVFDDLREVQKLTDMKPRNIIRNQLDSLIDSPSTSKANTSKIDPDAT